MRIRLITTLVSVVIMRVSMLAESFAAADAEIAQGKKLVFDRKKGNYLACPAIDGGTLAGNVGPHCL